MNLRLCSVHKKKQKNLIVLILLAYTVSEESAGWHVFLDRVFEQFPYIKKNGILKFHPPTFATNLTLVFEKDNKTLDESKAYYYKDI